MTVWGETERAGVIDLHQALVFICQFLTLAWVAWLVGSISLLSVPVILRTTPCGPAVWSGLACFTILDTALDDWTLWLLRLPHLCDGEELIGCMRLTDPQDSTKWGSHGGFVRARICLFLLKPVIFGNVCDIGHLASECSIQKSRPHLISKRKVWVEDSLDVEKFNTMELTSTHSYSCSCSL